MTRSLWILCVLVPMVADAQCSNPNMSETTPLSAFVIDNTAGLVTDTRTGLMWSRCLVGETAGPTCDGTPTWMPWDQALQAAAESTYAGYDDCRLPNRAELASIVEFCRGGPALNTAVFMNPGPCTTSSQDVRTFTTRTASRRCRMRAPRRSTRPAGSRSTSRAAAASCRSRSRWRRSSCVPCARSEKPGTPHQSGRGRSGVPIGHSSAARSHPPSSAAARYVLSRNDIN